MSRGAVLLTALAVVAAAASGCAADGSDAARPPATATTAEPGAGGNATAATAATTATTGTTGTTGRTASTAAPPTVPPSEPDLAAVSVRLAPFAQLSAPVALAWRPRDPIAGALYIAERAGTVRRVRADTSVDPLPIADITGRTRAQGERGLLGLTFSPDGAYLYLHYTDTNGDTNLDVFTVGPDGVAQAASRRRVLFQRQPFANHNGGEVRFGPDGMLYLGLGDGGSGGDPQGNGQSLSTWLGKILRLEPTPDGPEPYRVPADNPFVGRDGAKAEIWSFGLRNPWRFSWDRATDDLWIGDVGQDKIEEVDVARGSNAGKGVNYGWNAFEGPAVYDAGVTAPDAVGPFHSYARSDELGGCSVTGGYVYRGTAVPALAGAYVFADYCVPGIRAVQTAGGQQDRAVSLSTQPSQVASFGEGPDGELYVLSLTGSVQRIEPAG